MAGGVVPPMSSGMRGRCAGVGSIENPVQFRNSPRKSTSSPVQAAVMASMYSSARAPRRSNGTPSASNSSSSQPTPMPRSSRPPDRWSSDDACLAKYSALAWVTMLTPVPSRRRSVAPAMNVRAMNGSVKPASVGRPSLPLGLYGYRLS